jgi:hypothetical protein
MREQIGSGLTAAALGSRNSGPINSFVNFKAKPIQTSRPQILVLSRLIQQ